jgi:hypothetical protein
MLTRVSEGYTHPSCLGVRGLHPPIMKGGAVTPDNVLTHLVASGGGREECSGFILRTTPPKLDVSVPMSWMLVSRVMGGDRVGGRWGGAYAVL